MLQFSRRTSPTLPRAILESENGPAADILRPDGIDHDPELLPRRKFAEQHLRFRFCSHPTVSMRNMNRGKASSVTAQGDEPSAIRAEL